MAPAAAAGVLLAALLLLQGTSGEDIVSNIDSLVDNVITGIKTYLPEHRLTNITIPHIKANITIPNVPLFGDVSTGLFVDDAVVTNFYDVARFNDDLVTYSTDNKTLTVQFGLTLVDLEVAFILSLDRIIVIDKKDGTATIKKGMGSVTVSVNLETLKLKAEDVQIQDVGDVSLSVKGINFIISAAIKLLPALFKSTIKNLINTKGVSLLQGVFDKVDLNKILKPPATSATQ